MKIIKIKIIKLFGIFDHEIPLKTKEHITIIHGPNGYGKTILLTLVNAVFNLQYSKLFEIPFYELIIDFDDGSTLYVKKKNDSLIRENEKSKSKGQLKLELSKPPLKPKTAIIKPIDIDRVNIPFPLRFLEREIPNLEMIGPSTWQYLPTGETLSVDEVLDRFGDRLPRNFVNKDRYIEGDYEWFMEIKKSIDIHFIETQRLLQFSPIRINREFEERNSMIPAVLKYSNELAEAIRAKLAEYGSLAQKLDRTFPARLIKEKKGHSTRSTKEELERDLRELESKRAQLIAAGFLDAGQGIDDKDLQKVDESNIDVLSIYIHDVKEKLSIFDNLTEKIDLMVKIINNRFLYKQLSISKKEGFVFKTSGGMIIPLTSLSSGEQHELVLLYEMLFKVKPNSMILIDEPELSLHIIWQQQFLQELEQITRLVGFNILIATHSPDIINERWDLTVELKGPTSNEK